MKNTYWIGIGDVHGDPGPLQRIPGANEAAGIIVSGDFSDHGGPEAVSSILEMIRSVNPNVMAQTGNMDKPEAAALLADEGVSIHRAGRELAPGVGIMGVGYSSPTPFSTPSEVPDKTLSQWLEEAHAQVKGYDKLVAVIHDPPKGTKLDVVGGGTHVGSAAVRAFIERVQPDVVLTGHIHESDGEDVIGRTRIVNPGMLSSGGYAVISLRDGELSIEKRKA
jgi:Icc-related predicted phosphoesterase